MYEIMKSPIEAKDVIIFDYSNLIKFLDFIEYSNGKAHKEINDIKVRIKVLDEVEMNIKEINQKIDGINDRLEGYDKSLAFQSHKIMDLENNSKVQLEVRII